MEISFVAQTITINKTPIVFRQPIEKYLVFNEIIVVLIKGIEPENIYGVSESGQILWQIEKHSFIKNQENCVYTDISMFENNLASYNFCGFFCIVDYKTGKIISVEFSK